MENTVQTLEYEGTVFKMPYIDLLPRHNAERRAALATSIADVGVLEDLTITEDGTVIEGHTRLIISHGLGLPLKSLPIKRIAKATPEACVVMGLTLNLNRRQMDTNDWVKLCQTLRNSYQWSERRIAQETGLAKSTVHRHLEGNTDEPETITGQDGKVRDAAKPKRPTVEKQEDDDAGDCTGVGESPAAAQPQDEDGDGTEGLEASWGTPAAFAPNPANPVEEACRTSLIALGSLTRGLDKLDLMSDTFKGYLQQIKGAIQAKGNYAA